jgi:apolipoprotein N-acyltransferase
VITWLLYLLATTALVVAWWLPGSIECAALGWTSVALFVAALQVPQGRMKRSFVAGILTYIGGFYWLYGTISDFGGFPTVAALAIFALFAVGSAVQFAIWGFTWGRLPQWATRLGLRTALAWLVAHHFWIKIFPWDFGHTQIGFTPFALIADTVGVTGITFIMMFTQNSEGIALNTVMIQGNISLRRKHDQTSFSINREQYVKTSSLVADKDTLVIWPESTITNFLPDNLQQASESDLLPFFNNGSAFLVGALTYRSRQEFFNSSILIRPDGSVAPPYHKMILMPFGEYTPLSSLFPWMAEINATAAQFTPGREPSVLSFPLSSGTEVHVSPLICYEDVVPTMAQDATLRGAQLLVNQTNDAWFGDSVAPYQHHMIASFRAIENRRYLLRSTNTGLTAVVDPLGRTAASLLPFTEGVLPLEVMLISSLTPYCRFPVQLVWLLLSAGVVLLVTFPLRQTRQ